MAEKGLTLDTFYGGRIQVYQDAKGYRFSIDPIILAHHALPKQGAKVVDIGTGCGIIPLLIAYRNPSVRILAVEIQEELASIARHNVAANRIEGQITVLHQDMHQLTQDQLGGPVDLILSNPPYRREGSGRMNPDDQRAIARHEIQMTLTDLVSVAGRLLFTSGRLMMIYPVERLTDVMVEMRACNIEPKKLRMVHSRNGGPARLVVITGVKGGRAGLDVEPTLVIYQSDGTYTDELDKMCRP